LSRIIFHPLSDVERDDKRELRRRATRALELRRLRSEIFGTAISKEAAWEMLLALYANGRRLTVTELATTTEAPGTTALRWIDFLESQDLVFREASPTDLRISYINLTEHGVRLMEKYLVAMLA
jgi:DNA-binding MarR family transcriptional regulator